MANREALRALQGRLAERLQAARGAQAQVDWLAVEAGAGRYLLPLAQAGEIGACPPPHPVPHTQPWFLGVASLRGGLWGVVDLAAFLAAGADPGPVARDAADRPEARLVALGAALDVNCALRIDRLVGLRGAQAFRQACAPVAGAPAWLGPRRTDAQGQPWQELDLLALSRDPAFLAIGQARVDPPHVSPT